MQTCSSAALKCLTRLSADLRAAPVCLWEKNEPEVLLRAAECLCELSQHIKALQKRLKGTFFPNSQHFHKGSMRLFSQCGVQNSRKVVLMVQHVFHITVLKKMQKLLNVSQVQARKKKIATTCSSICPPHGWSWSLSSVTQQTKRLHHREPRWSERKCFPRVDSSSACYCIHDQNLCQSTDSAPADTLTSIQLLYAKTSCSITARFSSPGPPFPVCPRTRAFPEKESVTRVYTKQTT